MTRPAVPISHQALDVLMPMHLMLDQNRTIRHAGPTLLRLRPADQLIGRDFHDVFTIRRQKHAPINQAAETELVKLTLQFREGKATPLKGVMTELPAGYGALVNLSFGIGVIEAVRDYDLTVGDFAPTDLTIEMLYLVEAKSAAMEQSRDLNLRLQKAKAAAEKQAQTDALTGAHNLRALDHELERLVETRTPFTLMHLDLDFFKAVNDTLGHAAGDHVLRVVAAILREETRLGDIVARVGGDEFVLVLHGLVDASRAEEMAESIVARVAQPIPFEGQSCNIATSIGWTMSADYDRPDIERMRRDADAALYRSKHLGRGRQCWAAALGEMETADALPAAG